MDCSGRGMEASFFFSPLLTYTAVLWQECILYSSGLKAAAVSHEKLNFIPPDT